MVKHLDPPLKELDLEVDQCRLVDFDLLEMKLLELESLKEWNLRKQHSARQERLLLLEWAVE